MAALSTIGESMTIEFKTTPQPQKCTAWYNFDPETHKRVSVTINGPTDGSLTIDLETAKKLAEYLLKDTGL